VALTLLDPAALTGRRVAIYRNLSVGRQRVVWSIADLTRTGTMGRLIGHLDATTPIGLIDVTCGETGRAQTLRQARAAGQTPHREVCAWIAGTVIDPATIGPTSQQVSWDRDTGWGSFTGAPAALVATHITV
jgi:hypothetical protein